MLKLVKFVSFMLVTHYYLIIYLYYFAIKTCLDMKLRHFMKKAPPT